jgi:hypothetical protein
MLSADTLYIQLFATRIVARNLRSGESQVVQRDPKSASPRMLVAHFVTSQLEMKQAVQSVHRGMRGPHVLLHPMERVEGGVTQVEFRVLVELGRGAGGSRVGVHVGAPLADEAVPQAIRDFQLP